MANPKIVIAPYVVDFSVKVSSGYAPFSAIFINSTVPMPPVAPIPDNPRPAPIPVGKMMPLRGFSLPSPKPPGQITGKWLWDFGDGNFSSEQAPRHVYTKPGDYTVRLTLILSDGQTFTKTKESFVICKKPLPTDLATSVISYVSKKVAFINPMASTYNLFSSVDDTNHVYTKNQNLWCADVDWSCIPAFGTLGNCFGGALVTPDILIQACHAHESGPVYFVDAQNRVYQNNIITGSATNLTDIYVARLESPLPASIVPAKVLPPTAYLGSQVNIPNAVQWSRTVPIAFFNQFREMRIGVVFSMPVLTLVGKSGTDPLQNWYAPVINGDSGSPAFMIINGAPVMIGTWFLSDNESQSYAPSIAQNISDINATIAKLGSQTQLSTVDLSSYKLYKQ